MFPGSFPVTPGKNLKTIIPLIMSAEGQTWSFVKKNFILACNISSEVATPVFFLQRLYHNRYYNYETAMHLKNFKRTAIFSKNFSGTVSDFWRCDLGIYRKLHSSSGTFLKFSSPSACGLVKFQKWPSDSGNFLLKLHWIWQIIEFLKKFISKFHQIEIIIIYSKFSFMIWKFHQI